MAIGIFHRGESAAAVVLVIDDIAQTVAGSNHLRLAILKSNPAPLRRHNFSEVAAYGTCQPNFVPVAIENSDERTLLRSRGVVGFRRKICGAIRERPIPAEAVPVDTRIRKGIRKAASREIWVVNMGKIDLKSFGPVIQRNVGSSEGQRNDVGHVQVRLDGRETSAQANCE